jgi:hypothetical protein
LLLYNALILLFLLFDNGGLIDCDLVSCNLVSLDADRSDLIGDNNGNTLDGGFIECDDNNSKSDENSSDNNVEDGDDRILIAFGVRSNSKLYGNSFNSEDGTNTLDDNVDNEAASEGLSRSKFSSELLIPSTFDWIAFGVRSNSKLYDTDGILSVRCDDIFPSELITRSVDGGDLILLAVRCDNTLYDTDFNSEDGVDLILLGVRSDNALYDDVDTEGLSRSMFASELVTHDDSGDLIAFGVRSDSKLYGNDGGDLILLAVRCNNTLYDIDFTFEDGGDLILLAVRCDNT